MKLFFAVLPFYAVLILPYSAVGHTTRSDSELIRSQTVAQLFDWLNRKLDKLRDFVEKPFAPRESVAPVPIDSYYTPRESVAPVPTDLQQEMQRNDAQYKYLRENCLRQFRLLKASGFGEGGWSFYYVKDNKVYVMYSDCDGKKADPSIEYEGELGKIERIGNDSYQQWKFVNGKLCKYSKGSERDSTIYESCLNKL